VSGPFFWCFFGPAPRSYGARQTEAGGGSLHPRLTAVGLASQDATTQRQQLVFRLRLIHPRDPVARQRRRAVAKLEPGRHCLALTMGQASPSPCFGAINQAST
jgi:hypothetical protein